MFFKCSDKKCGAFSHLYSIEENFWATDYQCPECLSDAIEVPQDIVPSDVVNDFFKIEASFDESFDEPINFDEIDWFDDEPDFDDIKFQQMCYDEYF